MHLGRAQYVACDFLPFMNCLQICLSEVRHDEPLRDVNEGEEGLRRAHQLTDGGRHTNDPTIERSADDGVTKVSLRKTDQRSRPLELCDQSIGISHCLPGLPSGGKRRIQLALRGCFDRSS